MLLLIGCLKNLGDLVGIPPRGSSGSQSVLFQHELTVKPIEAGDSHTVNVTSSAAGLPLSPRGGGEHSYRGLMVLPHSYCFLASPLTESPHYLVRFTPPFIRP